MEVKCSVCGGKRFIAKFVEFDTFVVEGDKAIVYRPMEPFEFWAYIEEIECSYCGKKMSVKEFEGLEVEFR